MPSTARCRLSPRGLGGALTRCPTMPAGAVPPCPNHILQAVDNHLSSIQERFLWVMLVPEFLVAVAGNGLALYRFRTREPRPWHPGVVFSAQLATSDLLYALTLLPQAAYFYPPKHWRYGLALCLLERFLFTCNLLGSTVFISCISLNRYLGVVHPFFTRSHLRPKHAWALSAAGWALAAVLAAPTFHFTRLQVAQPCGNSSAQVPEGCTRCLGTASNSNLEAFWAYSLVLAGLGCGLPLLLTLAAYSALVRALQRSPSVTAAEKRRVAVLVASGLLLYATSYVPYYVTRVLNLSARRWWNRQCPQFANVTQAREALDLGAYNAYQVARGLVPLAMCVHPLLYMAVASSLRCCHPRQPGGEDPDAKSSGQALPLAGTTTRRVSETPELRPPTGPS
ncbi:P2Y purinoceptor 11 [Sorex araneus]|uniref:P2Y purinoceptor 11 n=1 Tax=Sorex araneus TaxID=42254 RepID=UPI002433EC5D|nr:P2Y purinoceptor 11 [Sorex araneus]